MSVVGMANGLCVNDEQGMPIGSHKNEQGRS